MYLDRFLRIISSRGRMDCPKARKALKQAYKTGIAYWTDSLFWICFGEYLKAKSNLDLEWSKEFMYK
jgi:hypothetical protein